MAERWIWIPKWEEFQHYRHGDARVPPWIKNYIDLLHKDAYLELTLHQRGVLHGLWLVFAAARRQVPGGTVTDTRQHRDSTTAVSRQLGHRVTRETLDALNHAGFLEFIDTPTLRRRRLRVEESREEEPLTPSEKGEQQTEKTGWNPRALGTNPRAVATAEKRDQAFKDFVSRFWEEYPDPAILLDELVDRGLELEAAQALIEAEQERRVVPA